MSCYFDLLNDDLMDKMLIANVRGPFSVIRELRPLLKAAADSVIVNLSSVSGFKGTGSSIAYVACKAAIDTMSLSLARVLGPEIRVNCVSPGAVATDFVAGRDREKSEHPVDALQTDGERHRLHRRLPDAGRLGEGGGHL